MILLSGNLPLASLSLPACSHRGCAAPMQMALQVPTSSTPALGWLVEKEEAAAPVSGVLKKTPKPSPLLQLCVTSQTFDSSCCWSLCRGEMGCKVFFFLAPKSSSGRAVSFSKMLLHVSAVGFITFTGGKVSKALQDELCLGSVCGCSHCIPTCPSRQNRHCQREQPQRRPGHGLQLLCHRRPHQRGEASPWLQEEWWLRLAD